MRAVRGHCPEYTSWLSLAAVDLADEDMADMVVDWLHGIEASDR